MLLLLFLPHGILWLVLGFANELYVVQISGLWVLGTIKQNTILAATLSLAAGHTTALHATTQAALFWLHTRLLQLFPLT